MDTKWDIKDTKLEKLENGIKDLKELKGDLDKNNDYFQQLLERMEQKIVQFEQNGLVQKMNNAELINSHGLMNSLKPSSYKEISENLHQYDKKI